jgi:hypothetical protein
LSLRHTNFENKIGGTPWCKKTKMKNIWLFFCILSWTFIKDLAAHPEKINGTLVRRGTPVEKHWYK